RAHKIPHGDAGADRRREPGRNAGQRLRCALRADERFAHRLIPAAASEHERAVELDLRREWLQAGARLEQRERADAFVAHAKLSGPRITGGAGGAIGTYTAAGATTTRD